MTPSDTDPLDETPVALPPRNRWELIAEACGALTYGIAIPLALALTTHDFFSARLPQDWRSALIVALVLCLYAWPLRLLSSPRFAPLRIGWWAGPFLPAFFLVHHAITTRHPYLNPFAPDHKQRAAEQVLGLKNNIMAGRHADWVLDYARQLETRGDSKRAAELYHATLRLDPVNQAAVERLAMLEPRPTTEASSAVAALPLAPLAPFWSASNPMTKADRRRITPSLETVSECTVILVPMGEVSDELLDAVAHTVHRELGLPVLISPDHIALPPSTRVRGLLTGRQWDHTTLVQAFLQAAHPLPNAPLKYLLVTSVDIYMDGAAFVFSTSYDTRRAGLVRPLFRRGAWDHHRVASHRKTVALRPAQRFQNSSVVRSPLRHQLHSKPCGIRPQRQSTHPRNAHPVSASGRRAQSWVAHSQGDLTVWIQQPICG